MVSRVSRHSPATRVESKVQGSGFGVHCPLYPVVPLSQCFPATRRRSKDQNSITENQRPKPLHEFSKIVPAVIREQPKANEALIYILHHVSMTEVTCIYNTSLHRSRSPTFFLVWFPRVSQQSLLGMSSLAFFTAARPPRIAAMAMPRRRAYH